MKLFIPILTLLLLPGCQNKPDSRSSSQSRTETELIDLNKSLITQDRAVIAEYIGRNELSFRETNTGLWYSVLAEGTGDTVNTGDNVTYDYECSLLDGKICYSGSQTIRVGYAGAESGENTLKSLEESLGKQLKNEIDSAIKRGAQAD